MTEPKPANTRSPCQLVTEFIYNYCAKCGCDEVDMNKCPNWPSNSPLNAETSLREKASRGQFSEVLMLLGDAQRMGVEINLKWSINRLRKEHDKAALRLALERSDPTPFAQKWTTDVDGYHFERLISGTDFSQAGISMRHCIASYQANARHGDLVVLKVTGPERATFAFRRNVNETRWQELQDFANSKVSQACSKACRVAMNTFATDAAKKGALS